MKTIRTFLSLLINVLKENNNWFLIRLTTGVLRSPLLLANLSSQYLVFKTISIPKFLGLSQKQPIFPFKYLSKRYLSKSFTTYCRASAFSHHYLLLHDRLSENFLNNILYDKAIIWQMEENANIFSIALAFSHPIHNEGELSLFFRVNEISVYILSFTFVPGNIVGLQAQDAILVTRAQGTKGQFPLIRLATKTFREVSPLSSLVYALQGIANALNIRHMVGVRGANYIYDNEPYPHDIDMKYEGFFVSIGAVKSSANLFYSSLPLQEKPLNLIKNGHRLRTKAKRKFKLQIADEVCQTFAKNCAPTKIKHADSVEEQHASW
jgi:uncharacterized protein VirK/YbjX